MSPEPAVTISDVSPPSQAPDIASNPSASTSSPSTSSLSPSSSKKSAGRHANTDVFVNAAEFVEWILHQAQKGSNKGELARLARATSASLEAQSWETLVRFGVDLDNENQRLAFVAIGAILAREKLTVDGRRGLGACLAAAYEDGNQSDQARARLRRLLACDDIQELVQALRPMLSLVHSRGAVPNHARLLRQLLTFAFDPQKIKVRWAQEFYRQPQEEAVENSP